MIDDGNDRVAPVLRRNCGVTMPSAASASTTIGSSKLNPNVSTIAKTKPEVLLGGDERDCIDVRPKPISQGSASGTTTKNASAAPAMNSSRPAEQDADRDALLVRVQRRREKQPELVEDDRRREDEAEGHRRVQRDAEFVARMREVELVLGK